MEQVYLTISNTFSATKELDATELAKVMLTIAKMGSPLQKQNLIQLLEELQTREERVKPKNYEISETQVMEGFNLELLKKYPMVDTNSRTITAVVPTNSNVTEEVNNLFLEMAYLKKCKATKKIPNLKLYVKKRKDLEQDNVFQAQKKKMNQTLQTSWMGKLLSIPNDTDNWARTKDRLLNEESDAPVLHVLQAKAGDRLGTPYTDYKLTTPIFQQDLKKYEDILQCSLPPPQKPSASSTPSRASFLQ